MRRGGKELLNFYVSLYSPNKQSPLTKLPSFTCALQGTSPFSNFSSSARDRPTTTTAEDEKSSSSSKSPRESLLEKFRLRKIKGSSKTSERSPNVSTFPASSSNALKETEKGLQNDVEPHKEINFKHLGLSEDLIGALEKIGVSVPSEVQCVGIPAVLEGKSVLLSSTSGSGRTLAYLLPLIQLLRRDAELSDCKSQRPRAILLCATEEKAEQCFNVAKILIHAAESKSAKDSTLSQNESIGLVIGTPNEILQYIEEGSVIPSEINYMVMDEADCMFDSGLGPIILKIVKPLEDHASNSSVKGLQIILVTSLISEMLGEERCVAKCHGYGDAAHISAVLLEMDQTEVFRLSKSMDALEKKVADAVDSVLQ